MSIFFNLIISDILCPLSSFIIKIYNVFVATAESGVFLDPNLDGIQGDMPHPTVIEGDQTLDSPPHSRAARITSDQLLPGSEIFSQMLKLGVLIDHSGSPDRTKLIAETHIKSHEKLEIIFQPRRPIRRFRQTRWSQSYALRRTSGR
ncbi:hypothetical protein E6Q11_02000 [Candidatus Dojkabacteria bacterium]|uniref:Uncharacterized protein n=1 Tax=Candidatus Dojkabacteria bacterium TaxID=2099670 RepID=A0A5C7J8Y0_9BACT|nr:MAG: hypothetical protein E6Q11_02000 [Candidatus Dojkabacteria bacterium]